MRGLAEFVMTGRKQAILAVVLLGAIPLINLLNPVVIGLIMLRKGLQEAGFILVWAILPIGAWAMAGDVVPLFMLLGVTALAYLLRTTESWEFTLVAAIVVGVGVEFYFRLEPAVLDLVLEQIELYLATNNLQDIQIEDVRETMLSFIGAVYMFLAIMLLMWSRWLQATLFNPGGFRQEFHSLRVEQKIALALIGLMLLANLVEPVPQGWVLYFVLPLLFSGVALIHAVVAKRKLSTLWLVTFYALFALPIVAQLVVLLALVDSWYNFRARLPNSV